MAAPIYKGGAPFFKPYIRFRNAVQAYWQNGSTGGVPVNGTSGTGAGKAGPGSTYVDFTGTNGVFYYINVGTAASPTWVPQSGAATPGYQRTTLTAANIIAMFTTPVNVIPAPATGTCIVVHNLAFEMIATATAFTGGGTVNFVYHGGAVAAANGTVAAAIVTATGPSTVFVQLGPNEVSTGQTITASVGIDITNGTGVFATGTGTAVVHAWFSTITP